MVTIRPRFIEIPDDLVFGAGDQKLTINYRPDGRIINEALGSSGKASEQSNYRYSDRYAHNKPSPVEKRGMVVLDFIVIAISDGVAVVQTRRRVCTLAANSAAILVAVADFRGCYYLFCAVARLFVAKGMDSLWVYGEIAVIAVDGRNAACHRNVRHAQYCSAQPSLLDDSRFLCRVDTVFAQTIWQCWK